MQDLGLLRLNDRSDVQGGRSSDRNLTRIGEKYARDSVLGLYADLQGGLRIVPMDDARMKQASLPNGGDLVAAVKCLEEDGVPAWYFVARSERLRINGCRRSVLTRVEPGALLSIDRHFWLASFIWQPLPEPVPVELADSYCPVCGGKLSEAPVVQCPGPNCGRWVHFERPDQPETQKFLNCFLAADRCPNCGHPATVDPIVVPEPHEKLLPAPIEAPW
jgi:hypothetical protein